MITRRNFIAFITSLPLYFGCRNNSQETVARELDLGPVEDFYQPVTPLPVYRVLVRNDGTAQEPDFKALRLICTHQHCALSIRADLKQLHCPCHGARFDFHGKVLQGPAEIDLHQHPVRIVQGRLIVDMGQVNESN